LTDGRSNTGAVDPLTAAKAVAAYGIRVYAIGTAGRGPATMTIDDPKQGRVTVQIDDDLDDELLAQIASLTGGKSYRAQTSGELAKVFAEIDRLEKSEIKRPPVVAVADHHVPHGAAEVALMFRAPLWLAAAVPALGAAWGLLAWGAARRRRVGAALGREAVLSRAGEDASARRRWSAGLRLTSLALILLALAGPQWGIDLVETRGAARQVVIAVDVSLSMQTADVKPNRLERAKASLSLLLDQLKGDRVGVVAFAGDAQVICPLTSDVDAAKELLSALEVGAIPTPGTSIGGALRLATAMVGRYPGSKTIVLLTDGEDHKSDPLGAAQEAAASGVRVYTVGIGTPEGEPIPLEGGGYKKDARGSTVVSRLGEGMLASAAKITGGEYERSSPGEDEISEIASKIKAGEAAQGLSGTAARWHDRYAWPLGLAFALLLLETALCLLPTNRAVKAAVVLALLAAASRPAAAATFEARLRDANKTYENKDYENALEQYGDASGRRPADPRPVFNAGDALYRLDRDTDAAGAFDSVAGRRDAPAALRAAALYNLGNSHYQLGDYAGAADAYRRALSLSPSDADARQNLVVAINHKKNPPKRDKNKKKDQDKNNPPPPPDQPKDKNDKGGGGGGQTKPRPQDSLTREDADRVMRTVAEREKAERKQAPPAAAYGRKPPPPKPPSEEDW
jgi:Ca-activated chloride channel family protein